VKLQIFQEASSVDAATINDSHGPTMNKRSIESTVVVDDNDIVVLGGLIQDTYGTNEEKVPVLGYIPLLGNLFRYQTRNRNKTNLMVFLQPRILRNAEESRDLAASRYDYVIGEQVKSGDNAKLMPGESAPAVLPPLQTLPAPRPAPAPQIEPQVLPPVNVQPVPQ
jgi:general secretion pathway protein D